MAIFKVSTFALVFSALLSAASVNGQTSITFDRCEKTVDERSNGSNNGFGNNRGGSQRRTYGNLCSGTIAAGASGNDANINSRIGHDFRVLCDLIDDNPNILALMSTGNSPHTIFAPTDAAFAKVDGLISRVNKQRLLELHLLPQARLARDLRCGQTYRTVNTNQSRRDNQRSKTRCISAARSQQLGPGNVVNGLKPTIGVPNNIFRKTQFSTQDHFVLNVNEAEDTANEETFSQDVISCNGVIHVVDEVLLPGGSNAFRNGPYYASPYYGGSRPNYYGGTSHTHGPYYGHYYGHGYYYRGRYNGPHYHKSSKKNKGAKGYKAGKGYGISPTPYYGVPYYYNGVFRKLDGGDDADAYEMPMSDEEFFGTSGLVQNEAEESTEEDLSNRKRRLEAMLEADGNIAQV